MEKIKRKRRKITSDIPLGIAYVVMGIIAISMIFPFIYMLCTTFKTQAEVLGAYKFELFPRKWTFQNYIDIWFKIPFASGIGNTLIIEIAVIPIGTLVSALGAFAFAKMKLPHKNAILLILMSSMMVPFAAIFLPQYQIWNSLGMTNSLIPLILPGLFGNISMTFFFIQFMKGIPDSLIEAAKMDGAGWLKCFVKVALPLLWPAMAAQAVFWFLGIWNDYFAPSIYLTEEGVMTLQPLINSLNSTQGATNFPLVMTGAFISSIPLIVIYLIFQKYFMKALSLSSGIK